MTQTKHETSEFDLLLRLVECPEDKEVLERLERMLEEKGERSIWYDVCRDHLERNRDTYYPSETKPANERPASY